MTTKTDVHNPANVTEFTCPECGSHAYGTSCAGYTDAADKDAFWRDHAMGSCHGAGCRFTWPRRHDSRYFRVVGRQETFLIGKRP